MEQTNIRPGRGNLVISLRNIANNIRTFLFFNIKTPWAIHNGMIRIPWSVNLWSPHKDIELGDRVQFGPNCIVHCDAEFGNDILVAGNVAFVGRDDHRYNVVGRTIWNSPRGDKLKVIVEDDVWIGYGAIILSGVIIGRGSVVAAGAVVTKDIPEYSIVGGNPATVVARRFDTNQIQVHEELLANYRCE